MGARRLQIWREIELPLAMPGILIGMLLTFVLAVGAVAEAKILGGQSIIVITHDIEIAFTYAQNWPLGSALAVLLMLVVGDADADRHRAASTSTASWGGADGSADALTPSPATERRRRATGFIWAWTGVVVVVRSTCRSCAASSPPSTSRAISAFPIAEYLVRLVAAHDPVDRDRRPGAHLAVDRRARHRASPS